MPIRAALYIDGFNLYHAVNHLGENFLKWCDLWRLGQIIIPSRTEALVRVVFCTAFYPGDSGRRSRHERFLRALETVGVECIKGHYVSDQMNCNACGVEWTKQTEKETDINLALAIYDDAVQDRYDHSYLLTADSDQAATARKLQQRFPEKRLTTVSPPGRNFSKDILRYAHAKISLSVDHIERANFGGHVMVDGKPPVLRPKEYDPPIGWVHPDKRPK